MKIASINELATRQIVNVYLDLQRIAGRTRYSHAQKFDDLTVEGIAKRLGQIGALNNVNVLGLRQFLDAKKKRGYQRQIEGKIFIAETLVISKLETDKRILYGMNSAQAHLMGLVKEFLMTQRGYGIYQIAKLFNVEEAKLASIEVVEKKPKTEKESQRSLQAKRKLEIENERIETGRDILRKFNAREEAKKIAPLNIEIGPSEVFGIPMFQAKRE